MFQNLITRIFRGRHYWRSVSFDEIAELYTSRLMTVFGVSMVSILAGLYLHKIGYSLVFIFLFYGFGYVFRGMFGLVSAYVSAFFGPKRSILTANLLRIPSMISFALVPDYGIVAIVLFGIFLMMSNSLYESGYVIHFSKVRNPLHSGREIGFVQIIEKVAKVVAPLIGGLVATFYGPEAVIVLASGLFVGAAIPLLRTAEPTATRQKLKISGYPWRLTWRSSLSQISVGFDVVTNGLIWSLFVGVVLFSSFGQGVYAAIGGLVSVGVAVSIVASWLFGLIIDRKQGDRLMGAGIVVSSLTHLSRLSANSIPNVAMINAVSEVGTSAYMMPLMRVIFDTADVSGFRATYVMITNMALSVGLALSCFVVAIAIATLGDKSGFMVVFVVASVMQLMLLLSRRLAK